MAEVTGIGLDWGVGVAEAEVIWELVANVTDVGGMKNTQVSGNLSYRVAGSGSETEYTTLNTQDT